MGSGNIKHPRLEHMFSFYSYTSFISKYDAYCGFLISFIRLKELLGTECLCQLPHSNSYVEALIPSVMVIGGGVFGRS